MRVVSFAVAALAAALVSGCMTPAATSGESAAAAPACPGTRNWTAHVNAMPGPEARPSLIVTGEVDVPRGFVPVLRAGPTDRMMPPGQRMSLSLEAGSGPAGWQAVRAEVVPALPQYREVRVACGGATVAVLADIVTAH